jgi:hypothetical protein
MMNFKLFEHRTDGVVYEVRSLVAHQNLGHPNLVITFSNKKCATISALHTSNKKSFTGVASAHLVRYSFLVMTYLAPVLLASGLISPINSIAHLSNACNVTCGCNDISSLLLGLPTH